MVICSMSDYIHLTWPIVGDQKEKAYNNKKQHQIYLLHFVAVIVGTGRRLVRRVKWYINERC